ncbi:uncharacterized protein LOC18445439 [Amborella trichopoda]|uniref:Uncharacterized protein n=1 Tax=Amborella trichopoda TaxID=13333 RepID=U5CUX4_AMBTC|nr:uncharacterized protein LOC18445439 [Amborella trichopoda]ERN17106.1 hypothetical protein AMTR_s00044p00105130 [Amborella trichopoda]|eukprot:XP_006855639.1 uncharacterized protein LOC18445439 [Amborella trichopoda]
MAIAATAFNPRKTIISTSLQLLGANKRIICQSSSFWCPNFCNSRVKAGYESRVLSAKLASDVIVHERVSETATGWREFCENVSGEWDGYGADFSSEGEPIELPESVVPEAFREWDVKVFDWQTQCPTLAETEEPKLVYKPTKLLPTVGCEADAATRYSIEERWIGGGNNGASTFSYHPSGCYVAVWPVDKHGLLELEYCLVDPGNRESRTRISRTRIIQVVEVEKDNGEQKTVMRLRNIKVFSEQWYGPFRNGEQLGGCAISGSGFATTDVLKDSEVTGSWESQIFVASFKNSQHELFRELVDQMPQKVTRDLCDLVLLPKQLWCSLKENTIGETWGEVGCLAGPGNVITSRCVFSKNGVLQEMAIGYESRNSEIEE